MTNNELNKLAKHIYGKYEKKYTFSIEANFYKSKTLNSHIEISHPSILIKISTQLQNLPIDIISALLHMLFRKIFKLPADKKTNQQYRNYIREHILPTHQTRERKPSSKYTPAGTVYNLEVLFTKLNQTYFNSQLKKPTLGWSLNKSYTRLGFYSTEKNLLVISKIFDSKKVKQAIVEFLLFHEMLHIYLPVLNTGQRRIVHSPEFRKLERSFPNYARIHRWLQRKRHRL